MARMDADEKSDLQRLGRRSLWMLTWALPLAALIVGIALTVNGTADVSTPVGDDMYDITLVAVWPAGLVLLGVGALGLIAAALVSAVFVTKEYAVVSSAR